MKPVTDTFIANNKGMEAVNMRVDAYNAISQLYQTKSVSSVKKSSGTQSFKDKLEISAAAKSYQTARTAVADAPDVREDKIAEIKAQMSAGTYYVSSEAVADKIINSVETIAF